MLKKLLWAGGVVVTLIVGSISGLVGKEVGKSISSQQPTQAQIDQKINEVFTRVAREANSRGPVMVDEETRLDRIDAGPGPMATYHHTFVNYSSAMLEPSQVTAIAAEVTKSVCASVEMKESLKLGASYTYMYNANDGHLVQRFTVSRRDCGF